MDAQNIFYLQPWEIRTNVTEKVTAKGDAQPEISISIIRKLESDSNIIELIEHDVDFAVDKCKTALQKLRELG